MRTLQWCWLAGCRAAVCVGVLWCCLSCTGDTTPPGRAEARRATLALHIHTAEDDSPPLLVAAGQGRQVERGTVGFLELLEVRLLAAGTEVVRQVFSLAEAEQERVVVDLPLPEGPRPLPVTILVSARNAATYGAQEIYRGETSLQLGQTQEDVTIELFRVLAPIPASRTTFEHRTYIFRESTAFGLPGTQSFLAGGTFAGDQGDFALVAGNAAAQGILSVASCTFGITASTFPPGQGPQPGTRLVFDACTVDAVDNRLIFMNRALATTAISGPPESRANTLPPPNPLPGITTTVDTPGTIEVAFTAPPGRTAQVVFAITIPPSRGLATVSPTGTVTYNPAPAFLGSDSLLLTVTAIFTDGGTLPVGVGTIPVAITVQSGP